MTKKDYEAFANAIHNKIQMEKQTNGVSKESCDTHNNWIALVADVFANDNPLFQRVKFERACYEGMHIRRSIKEAV